MSLMKENLYYAKERIELLLNIEDGDRQKFENLYAWCPKAMEYTVKEKLCRINPEEGEIWTGDFGFNVGSEIDKTRPLIITNRNNKSNIVSVAPISHANQVFDTHVKIEDRFLCYKEADIDGSIKVEQERAFSKARLGRRIGKLSEEGMLEVKRAILTHHNITPEMLVRMFPDVLQLKIVETTGSNK
jgi:Growth inhibitor